MKQYIDKSKLLGELKNCEKICEDYMLSHKDAVSQGIANAKRAMCQHIIKIINTLETKEVEEKFECPNIKIKDAIEVSSRMKYIDEDLKQIADFIMDYASWNLHKDEWNQPVLEVPLFRVLDALAQKGKPYCCG